MTSVLLACSFLPKSIQEHFKDSDKVFKGILISKTTDNGSLKYNDVEFSVEKIWKGDPSESYSFKNYDPNKLYYTSGENIRSSCTAKELNIGSTYIIYSSNNSISYGSRSKSLDSIDYQLEVNTLDAIINTEGGGGCFLK